MKNDRRATPAQRPITVNYVNTDRQVGEVYAEHWFMSNKQYEHGEFS